MITAKAFAEAVLKYRDSDNINPVDSGGSCLYTNPHDPTQHCLIGQVVVDLGEELPDDADDEVTPARTLLHRYGADYEVAKLADSLQHAADTGPTRWGAVIDDYAEDLERLAR